MTVIVPPGAARSDFQVRTFSPVLVFHSLTLFSPAVQMWAPVPKMQCSFPRCLISRLMYSSDGDLSLEPKKLPVL